MPAMESQGQIYRMEIENFKSYKGYQIIRPFRGFTAIIGPSDSAKSDLMDAISFVLGVGTGEVRGGQLNDLIYASHGRASVKLVYGLGDGSEVLFTRTITSAGGSEYQIDNIVVNWDEYSRRLKSLGIAGNFLVFQGDVESVASKDPKELTKLLEQISGSDEDKRLYEDLEEKKGAAEEKSRLANQKKWTIVMERKQKVEAEKHKHLQEQLLFNTENDEKAIEEIDAESRSLPENDEKEKEQAQNREEIDKFEKKIAQKKNKIDKNEKERAASKELEEAREEEQQIGKQFESVRNRRLTRFIEAFNHISGNIDKIYKQLTKSSTHPLGGTAYLNLDNEDEPFLHGIKYTAMPPTKRFPDMEQLSGGEKTVAALALLFSIHSYKPSPFFILDEVDAALDDLNVAKVAEFISQQLLEVNAFQTITISRKASFYNNAEVLIGVYSDFETGGSRALTYDLRKTIQL